MTSFEVGIIGAGIHGASAAYHLAAQAVSTVVFEKTVPAGGPTGRSSAICRAYYTNEFLAGVARESIDMLRELDAVDGNDPGYRETGLLYLHPAEDAQELEHNAQRLNALDVEVELLDAARLAERYPDVSLHGIGVGAWEPKAGYADPAGSTSALFTHALKHGMTARTNTTVIGLESRSGGGAVVVTDDGERTECERLLIAAGPWTRPLAQLLGADLPLIVERHVVATFGWGTAPKFSFGFADLPGGYYFKPEGADLFCLGPLDEGAQVDPDDFDEEISSLESDELAGALVDRVPAFAEAETRGGWASLYDVSPDWQPIIGEIADGIFVDAGTSGHGFKLAPALGRHVADLVTGKPVDAGLEQFHPARFGEGRELAAGYGAVRILG